MSICPLVIYVINYIPFKICFFFQEIKTLQAQMEEKKTQSSSAVEIEKLQKQVYSFERLTSFKCTFHEQMQSWHCYHVFVFHVFETKFYIFMDLTSFTFGCYIFVFLFKMEEAMDNDEDDKADELFRRIEKLKAKGTTINLPNDIPHAR